MKLIHNYLLEKQLCENDMVRVFRARDRERQELFTLTVIKDSYQINPDYLLSMISERTKGQSEHPHVAKIIDFGELRQQQYFVSPYAGGRTLTSFLKSPVPITFAVDVISQLASGLHFLALQGRIHGNINPDNVFFDRYGNAVLSGQEIIPKFVDDKQINISRYHSPEVVVGDVVDERSDLYSLGVILFELLTSEKFSSRKYLDESQDVNELVPFLPQDNFGFQPIINKLLAKNPKQRYNNGLELVDALDEYDSRLSHELEPDFTLDFDDHLENDVKINSDDDYDYSADSELNDKFEYGSFNDEKLAIDSQPAHVEIKDTVESFFINADDEGSKPESNDSTLFDTNDNSTFIDESNNNSQNIESQHSKSLLSLFSGIKKRLKIQNEVKRENKRNKNMFDISADYRGKAEFSVKTHGSESSSDVGINGVEGLKKGQASYASNFDSDIGSYLNTNDQILKEENTASDLVANSLRGKSPEQNLEPSSSFEFGDKPSFKQNAIRAFDLKNISLKSSLQKKVSYVGGVVTFLVVAIVFFIGDENDWSNDFIADQKAEQEDALGLSEMAGKGTERGDMQLNASHSTHKSLESNNAQTAFIKNEKLKNAVDLDEPSKKILSAKLPANLTTEQILKDSMDSRVAAVISQVISVKNNVPPLITIDDVDTTQKTAIYLSEKVDMLLVKAQGYLGQLKFTTPKHKNAYAMYVAVLNIDPDNNEAKEGIENIAESYAFMANRQIDKENYQKANRYIEKGLAVQHDNEWLVKLKREVNEWLDVDEKKEPLGKGAEAIAFDGLFD